MLQSDKRLIVKFITEKSFCYFLTVESEKEHSMHSFYADSSTHTVFFGKNDINLNGQYL
jgi:hypothetical protein